MWRCSGQRPSLRGDRLGVEAQLQDVAGLGLVAGELGVDRLVDERAVGQIDPLEEVGDPPHAVVHERHLEDDVVALGEHVADPGDPRGERLVAAFPLGHLEHVAAVGPVLREHRLFVVEALLQQHLRHLAEQVRRRFTRAGVDLVLQRQVVRAVEPRRDLRRGQQLFGHRVILTAGSGNAVLSGGESGGAMGTRPCAGAPRDPASRHLRVPRRVCGTECRCAAGVAGSGSQCHGLERSWLSPHRPELGCTIGSMPRESAVLLRASAGTGPASTVPLSRAGERIADRAFGGEGAIGFTDGAVLAVDAVPVHGGHGRHRQMFFISILSTVVGARGGNRTRQSWSIVSDYQPGATTAPRSPRSTSSRRAQSGPGGGDER